MWNRILQITIAFLLIFSMACDTSSNNGETASRYFEFTHMNEEIDYSFIAKTSDPEVIDKIEDQLERTFDQRNLHINGDIERGNGGYNNEWSWKFIPGRWNIYERSMEVCDGRPGMVEEDLDYWVDQVGNFCPWSSRVVEEVNP